MIRDIVQVGDPVLREIAREIGRDEILGVSIQELIADMRATMRAAPGVGLAAPQIGVSLRIAVIEDRIELLENVSQEILAERDRRAVPFHVIVNPVLEVVDPTPLEFVEGCLSFAGFVGLVPRARAVRVTCLDDRAQPVSIEAHGWYARILQHEIDHLDGVVCIDRMRTRTLSTVANYTTFGG